MTEQPKRKSSRGGRRDPVGGRPVTTGTTRKATQVSFMQSDLDIIEALQSAGYGANRTEIIRRAIREALERIRTIS